jgi:fructokinase
MPAALIFGEALVDVFAEGPVVGGAPLNVAVHLARSGWRVSLLTRIGEDDHGEAIVHLLQEEGVLEDLVQREAGSTGWVSVETSIDGEPSYLIHQGVAWDRITCPSPLPEVDLFYFGTLAARSTESRRTLESLLQREFSWNVFDVNLRQNFWSPTQVAEGAARARLIKVNEDEFQVLAEPLGVLEGAAGAFEKFPRLDYLCLTRGGKGAELWTRREGTFRVAVPRVEVVDTVGAGDCFLAALVRGLVEEVGAQEALEGAVTAAARVVQHRGALA